MSDYFERLRGRVDRRHIAQATIACVGLGRVGAPIAVELARLVPRELILIDGDDYELHNVSAHPLPREFVGWNKSVALAEHLHREYPEIANVTAIPSFIGAEVEDDQIRTDVLGRASVVVIATDQLSVQRRIAHLAREIDVPAVIPGLAEDGRRGEVFVSLSTAMPCVECYDAFRPADDPVRGASLAAPDAYPTIQLAFSLAVALLNPEAREAELLRPLRRGGPIPQLFRAWAPGAAELSLADDGRTEVAWRENCPGCGGQQQAARGGVPRMAVTATRLLEDRPIDWPSLDDLDPDTFWQAAGFALGAELFLLIVFGWSFGVVAAFMCLGIGIAIGLWWGLFGGDRWAR